MKYMSPLVAVLFTLSCQSAADAAVLVSWDFTNIAANAGTAQDPRIKTNIAADSTFSGLSVSNLSTTTAGNSTGVAGSLVSSNQIVSGDATAAFDGRAYVMNYTNVVTDMSTDPAATTKGNLSFSVTAAAGHSLTIDSMSISLGYAFNYTGTLSYWVAPEYNLYYSLDGGANYTKVGSVSTPTVNTSDFTSGPGYAIESSVDKDLDSLVVGPGSTVTFLLAFSKGSTSDAPLRQLIVDDITLEGVYAAVPEPATASVLLAGLALAGFRLRRRSVLR